MNHELIHFDVYSGGGDASWWGWIQNAKEKVRKIVSEYYPGVT